MNKKNQIAQIILTELDQFENFNPEQFNVTKKIFLTGTPQRDEIYEAIKDVNASEMLCAEEPFVAYIKVKETENDTDWQERIYLVCRNYQPLKISAKNPLATFLNRNAPAGIIASTDVGDDGHFYVIRRHRKVKKTFEVLEKNIFIPRKESKWDAIKNQISYDFKEDFIPSLRDLFGLVKKAFSKNQNPENELVKEEPLKLGKEVNQKEILGLKFVKEIEETENKAIEDRNEELRTKQVRKKAITDSIALKDQPILDNAQDKFCRLHISSQILLVGSPGTGKTTTLIKRLNYKSDPYHLLQTDEIELENDQLKSWLMFTPNDLLKIYLKEAMVKEGLQATEEKVTTWENERTNLGRHILKFLKTPKSGTFSRANSETLKEFSSENLIIFTNDFIHFFNERIQKNFAETTDFVEKNRLNPEVITKENFKLGDKFNKFADRCKQITQSSANRKISDIEIKTIYLIDDFQRLKSELTELRSGIRDAVKKILNEFVVQNPEIIKQVSQIIAESKNQDGNSEKLESIEATEETDADDLEEEELHEELETDIRVEAIRLIRQVFLRYAESLVLHKPLRNKRQLQVWNIMSPFFTDKKLLNFLGRINLSVRKKIFSQLDFDRILEQIPVIYEKFRQELFKSENSNPFTASSIESIKNKRISLNEADVLIYAMLRFASKIFQEKRDFLRKEQNFDILENIKSQYRTQIAVDEAADFSAVQLGSMFHLAHPKYKSVSLAGDLMQRVTSSGLRSWKECEFITSDFKTKELIISYRQTPVLLQIASKLYENVIGQKAPFHSKSKHKEQDPRPLKFKTSNDDALGDWITERVHEIYEIHKPSFPSIAVFVPEESDIDLIYEIIAEKLNDISVDVEKCKEGKVLGSGSKVRIFSVEYIKGLEFEGVFFVGIDDIDERKPDLLDKYLYVGLTRATTFLGVTYKTQFPDKIQFVENDFSEGNWSEFVE